MIIKESQHTNFGEFVHVQQILSFDLRNKIVCGSFLFKKKMLYIFNNLLKMFEEKRKKIMTSLFYFNYIFL